MAKAMWNGQLLAESEETEIVDGNHYFPRASLKDEYFRPSSATSVCGWKGTANYYDVVVGEKVNEQAAWFYAEPKQAAENIRGYVAFWKGVEVSA